MSEHQPSYYAVIPANVRYDKKLPAMAKLLYGEITCLTQKEGYCWASNSYFADLYGLSKDRISKLLNILKNEGYICIDVQRNDKNEVVNRFIKLNENITTPHSENTGTHHSENTATPQVKNNEYNNTSNNNTRVNNINLNNIDNFSEPPKKDNLPPEAKELAMYLYHECQKNDSHFVRTEQQLTTWANDIDKLHRIDKRDWIEIKAVLSWAKNNDFWKSNILSGKKFRDKYEMLFSQMKSKSKTVFMKNDVYKGDAW